MKRMVIAASLAALIGLSGIGQAPADETTLVIGAPISKTGWNAPYDSPVMDGFAVAMDEINAAGGIAGKYKVQVVTLDNRSDNAQNAIVTQDLIDQGVKFLIVACDSSMVHATAQLVVAAQLPAISTCSSSPTLPMTGNGYIFANAVTDNVQGAAQAEYAIGQGYKNAYLLRSPDIEYTQMPLYFAEAFKKLGGNVVGESIYALNQPDFSAEVTKIKQLYPQPDVIVTSAFEPDFPPLSVSCAARA
jgi:branched-chain amino acid transport system substrate-binding protein